MDGQVRFSGILTQELSQNLDFFNWNKVKIRYCDGASFAGHPESEFKASPVDVFQLVEYMSLPASQYSVLDAGSIERVDNSTFRCYVYNFKFFAFEVCPVLLLEGSPIVVAQNEKIDASMVNRVSCNRKQSDSSVDELTSDTAIEVSIEIPFAFRPIPVQAIESTDTQVLEQILRIMLPCFMAQVCDLDIFPL
ncbi:hypothetical protein HYC85_029054 [Camellia sinensis]|uniref:Pectin acetylesterase n=1 Tax=Camellia sinensis TaxID=4442 RepID=A0A7J7FWW6_CAMSI|nr:hypothetical protein HYC85_029054 [Camellia sinensis]